MHALLLALQIATLREEPKFVDIRADDPAARVERAISDMEARLGRADHSSPTRSIQGAIPITLAGTRFANDSGNVHLFVTLGPLDAVCHHIMPSAGFSRAVLQGATASCLRGLAERAQTAKAGGAGSIPSKPAAPVAQAPSSTPARFPGNWNKVEGVYFRLTQMVGFGGMPYPDYAPLILFKDGSYMDVQEAPLEDVDLASNRAAKPRSWGTWTRSGGGYRLTDYKGRGEQVKLQGGDFFKALPAGARQLTTSYKRVSGGGNSAIGGELGIAMSSKYTFNARGSFIKAGSFGALGSGQTSGVATAHSAKRRQGPGSYQLDHHTLVLRHADGRETRHFFAFGSEGAGAKLDPEMIFIGDTAFVHMD